MRKNTTKTLFGITFLLAFTFSLAGCQLPNDQTTKHPNDQTPDSLYTEAAGKPHHRPLPEGEGAVEDGTLLFQRFTSLIQDEQLYCDVTLDRDTVCQRLAIDRHTLNQLLNTYADGLSLPAYINNVRLDKAYKLLRDEPEKSIADIAAAVGFTPQNLRLQFKKRYGITPTEYRQNR